MPYCPRFLPHFSCASPAHLVWDLWAIGMVIFEVLAGPELVIWLTWYDEAEELLRDVGRFIEEDVHHLINGLLFECDPSVIERSILLGTFTSMNEVELSINSLEDAKKTYEDLKFRVQDFDAYAILKRRELKEDLGFEIA